MRILGIDPGTSLIGYGVIDYDKSTYTSLEHGAFRTQANIKNRDRVKDIFSFFDTLIKKWQPEALAIEELFHTVNTKTVIPVGEIRGVLLLVGAMNGLRIQEFTPPQVKQAVTGYGRAEKKQIQAMTKLILQLEEEPKPDDVADALALAICCANTIVY